MNLHRKVDSISREDGKHVSERVLSEFSGYTENFPMLDTYLDELAEKYGRDHALAILLAYGTRAIVRICRANARRSKH